MARILLIDDDRAVRLSDEGAVILAIYRKPNVFQNSAGYARLGS